MSLENIIKYATNTPTNTNPAVMSSVINSSFKQTKEEILNEAKPKIIDLTKFMCVFQGETYSFNHVCYSMLVASIYGDKVEKVEVTDVDGLLRKEITTNRQVVTQITNQTVVTEFLCNKAIDVTLNRAVIVSTNGIINIEGVRYEVKFSAFFYNNTDNVVLELKATPFV